MHNLQRAGMQYLQPYSRLAEVVHLLVEAAHVNAALVIHKNRTYQTDFEPRIAYAYAKVYILAHHILEITHRVIDLLREAHVERARAELLHHRLAATYATRCPERKPSFMLLAMTIQT